MWADEALERFKKIPDVLTVIDVGSGDSEHAGILRAAGKSVTTVALEAPADVIGDYVKTKLGTVDGIWASHVLEHVPNVGVFLAKCFKDLREGGVLAVTVPVPNGNVYGGHVSDWNAGLLLYRLILAGFDCRHAMVGTYDCNISVIVRKVPAALPALAMDKGDIERLAEFFPFAATQGFTGKLSDIDWNRHNV